MLLYNQYNFAFLPNDTISLALLSFLNTTIVPAGLVSDKKPLNIDLLLNPHVRTLGTTINETV